MLLYLVRHGQSAGSIPGSHGSPNPDLSEVGKAQAEATGRALLGVPVQAILCSPLTRALQTAHIMAKHVEATVEAWPELAESDPTAWRLPKKKREGHFTAGWGHGVGLTANQTVRDFPGTKAVGFFGDEHWWVDLWSEGRGRTYRRGRKAIRRLCKRWADAEGAVVLVTHGSFGSVLLSALTESARTDYMRFGQHTCGISLVELTSKGTRLRYLNRVDHLPPELRTDLT